MVQAGPPGELDQELPLPREDLLQRHRDREPRGPIDLLAQRLAQATERFTDVVTKDVPRFSAELRKTALRDVIGAVTP